MEIVTKKVKELVPYEKNPRKNDKAVPMVKASIAEFGFKIPIVIDKNNVVVCGHTRLKAAKQLRLKEVPCVIADDLSEEQVKAFRLADNKVAEQATWDIKLLDEEIGDIFSIDMTDFGFELTEAEEPTEEESWYGDERERTFDYYNMKEVDFENITEKWEMPTIKRCGHVPTDLISFNYMLSTDAFEKGIHFYIDDYQFERMWNNPHEYLERLGKFDCVLTPDFSLYTDMTLPTQIWNVYRSRLIGQIMQKAGIKVIPTLQWCGPNSYDFCFDGIEPGGVVSVSTVGVKRDETASNLWYMGMKEALKRLNPRVVVVYGGDIGFDFGKTKVVYIENHNSERFKANKTEQSLLN